MRKFLCALLCALAVLSGLAGTRAEAPVGITINGIEASAEAVADVPVDAGNPSVVIAWEGTAGATYGVQITSDDGSTVASMADVAQATVRLEGDALETGPVYTLQIGEADNDGGIGAWRTVRFTLVAAEQASLAEAPVILIDGEAAGDAPLTVALAGREKGVELRWSAEGQVRAFCVDVTDADGNTVVSMADVYIMTLVLETDALAPDTTYVVRVGAVPVYNGGATVWREARFHTGAAAEPTPEPTPEPMPEPTSEPVPEPTPTPEPAFEPTDAPTAVPDGEATAEPTPTPVPVGAPDIRIDGAASDGSPVVIEADGRMADIGIRWQATGDVRGYNVQVTDAEQRTLASLADTERTEVSFAPDELEIGMLYTVSVEALPMGEGRPEPGRAEFLLQSSSAPGPGKGLPGLSPSALSPVDRGRIVRVAFVDTLAGAPEDAWDASEDGNGAVLAWTDDTPQGVTLTIAGQGGVQAPARLDGLFADCASLEEIQFNGLFDTSRTTGMRGVFQNCARLKTLDLSGWATGRATDMGGMFQGCESLKYIDLSGWNTGRVADMQDMFRGCGSLQYLDTSDLNVDAAQNLGGMFRDCAALMGLDLSGFVTARGQHFEGMLAGCARLAEVTVGEGFALLDVAAAARADMFADCPAQVACEGRALAADAWLESVCVTPNLARGDRGASVRWMQLALRRLGFLKGAADGIFGNQTLRALNDYQRAAGLAESGTADLDTLRALCADAAARKAEA